MKDMKQLLEDTFQNDPVRREIRINNLENDLFTEKILSMHPETTYSTIEAGKIIGRKDSTLRNYFQRELVDYIRPEKSGIYYRLNYESIFKLHMILLLVDKANKTTSDIAFYTGISSSVSLGRNNKSENEITASQQEYIIRMKQILEHQELKNIILEENNELIHLKLELSQIEMNESLLKQEVTQLEIRNQNRKLENKYMRTLSYSLQKTIDYKTGQKKGIFDWFKGNQKGDKDLKAEDLIKESLNDSNLDEINFYQKEVEKIEKQISQIKEEKQDLLALISEKENQIIDSKDKLLKYTTHLQSGDTPTIE